MLFEVAHIVVDVKQLYTFVDVSLYIPIELLKHHHELYEVLPLLAYVTSILIRRCSTGCLSHLLLDQLFIFLVFRLNMRKKVSKQSLIIHD
jgi:hypothetical protein